MNDLRRLHARQHSDAMAAGDVWRTTNLDIGLANAVWLVDDQPELAQQRATSAIRRWSRRGFHLQHYWGALARAEAALYLGEPEAAWSIACECWPELKQSGLLGTRAVRIEAGYWRARVALAVCAAAPEPRLRRVVRKAARDIERERLVVSPAWSSLLRAGLARAGGATDRAVELLRRAATGFDDANMPLHAEACRLALGAASAMERMREAGVVDPPRFAAVLCPGFHLAT